MSLTKPRILVTGATGQVGRELVAKLANDPTIDVVGASRSPDTTGLDIPMVLLDFEDFSTIEPALEGVDRLFIVTGYTVDMLRQSKALIDKAKKAGVKQIVHLGACGDDETDVAHYGWHQFVERYIAATGLKYTHLRPEIFMQNLLGYGGVPMVNNGVLQHHIGDAAWSWVDTSDIAEVAATALRSPETHHGKTYRLGYDAMNFHQVVEIISRVIGQPVRYEARPPEEFLDGVLKAGGEPAYMTCVYESFKRLGNGDLVGHDQIFDNFGAITGKTPSSIEDFVRRNADSFRY